MNKIIEFTGPFKDIIPEYINYKRSLGFAYHSSICRVLKNLDEFFKKYNMTEIYLTENMVREYIALRNNESEGTTLIRCSAIREFAKYLIRQGYSNIYVLPRQFKIKYSYNFTPHIYTENEMNLIFEYLDNLPIRKAHKNYHLVYPALIRMLYGCGTRITETLSLKVSDIDISTSIIQILNGKGNVSRRIVMSESLTNYIKMYIDKMQLSDEDLLFPSPHNNCYDKITIGKFYRKTLRKLNIKNIYGKTPRIHDLRHTFAVNSLNKMIDSNMDIYCTLPFLSSYLGHATILETEKYLRLTNEYFSKITQPTETVNSIFKEVIIDE